MPSSYTKIRPTYQTLLNIFWDFGWELLQHPPYSPSLSPPDHDLIIKEKQLLYEDQFASREDILTFVWHNTAQMSMSGDANVIHRISHHWQ